MPQVTVPIESGADDVEPRRTASVGVYPPNTTTTIDTTWTFAAVIRSLEASGFEIRNAVFGFNTGNYLPDDATVTVARFEGYCANRFSQDSLSFVMEYGDFAFTTADYTAGTANNAHAGTLVSSITNDAVNQFALTNLANISTTGRTELRATLTQLSGDANPTGTNGLRIHTYEDTVQEPRLVIDYTVPNTERLTPSSIVSQSGFSPALVLADLQVDPDS